MSFSGQQNEKPLISSISSKGKNVYPEPDTSFTRRVSGFLSRHGKKFVRVVGIAGLLVSVYLLAGGVYCLAQRSTSHDSSGYFSTWNLSMEKETCAVIFNSEGEWVIGEIGSLLFAVTSDDPDRQVFMGVAPTDDVAAYLQGTDHQEVTGLKIFPPVASYTAVEGDTSIAPPLSQDFWTRTNSGIEMTMRWNLPEGETLVVMNADGSYGLDVKTEIRSSTGYMFMAGVMNLMAGGFVLMLSLFAVLFAGRSATTVYPVPLETLYEREVLSKKSNR